MSLDWVKMFRRYVYDEDKTPYFTAVSKLNKRQARNEIFIYAFLVGVVFAVFGFISLSGKLPHGDVVGVPIYAFFTAWMAGAFIWSKNQMAGAACALAPIAIAFYLILFGFPPKLGINDKVLICAGLLCWMLYSWRVILLAARYPEMPEPTDPPKPLRRNPFDMLK